MDEKRRAHPLNYLTLRGGTNALEAAPLISIDQRRPFNARQGALLGPLSGVSRRTLRRDGGDPVVRQCCASRRGKSYWVYDLLRKGGIGAHHATG